MRALLVCVLLLLVLWLPALLEPEVRALLVSCCCCFAAVADAACAHGVARARGACAARVVVVLLLLMLQLPALLEPEVHALLVYVLLLPVLWFPA